MLGFALGVIYVFCFCGQWPSVLMDVVREDEGSWCERRRCRSETLNKKDDMLWLTPNWMSPKGEKKGCAIVFCLRNSHPTKLGFKK